MDKVGGFEPLDCSRHHARLLDVINGFRDNGTLDGAIVTSSANVRWLTGFTGSSGVAIARPGEPLLLITDGRYTEQAKHEAAACRVSLEVVTRTSMAEMRDAIAEVIVRGSLWGIEADNVSLSDHEALLATCGRRGVPLERRNFVDITSLFVGLRRTKSPAEIQRIRHAAQVADRALADVAHLVRVGTSERQFRNELDAAMRRHGADDVSFATIVASGPNAALPHHHPGDRSFDAGDAVVVDFGALVDGYHSDMTRTFVIDGPGSTDMLVRHDLVRRACEAGVAVVGPGVKASDIDAACRSVLASGGLEAELTHGVGHGVGLQIHEAPWINSRSTDVLQPGDVVTVEPGAYRVGLGGVRVEELLVVTESGHLVLTRSPKEPICPQSPRTTSRTG